MRAEKHLCHPAKRINDKKEDMWMNQLCIKVCLKVCLKMEPWGTPQLTESKSELRQFKLTYCFLFVK